jgi:hypothetical protein
VVKISKPHFAKVILEENQYFIDMTESREIRDETKNLPEDLGIYDDKRIYDHEDLILAAWDYNRYNPAHDPNENPWIDVFGPGDEAETAYWNTD